MGTEFNPAAQRCSARKTNGEPCPQVAMRGQTVCYVHGGAAPQNRKAAQRRLAKVDADKQLAEMGYEPVTDPIATLADVAGRSVALMDWFEARVEALHQELRYPSSEVGTEQLRSEVVLLERAMDRVGKLASRLAELGYEERRVRVEEAQLDLMAEAIRLALAELGLAERYDEAITVVARHVAELEAAAVDA